MSEIGGVCRVNGNLNLSRAIGDLKYKANQTLQAKDQIITAEPDVRKVALQPEVRARHGAFMRQPGLNAPPIHAAVRMAWRLHA